MPAIASTDIEGFLEASVNLKREDAERYRGQVRYLRERLAVYIAENPDFDLVKILHFGSLANGTATSTLNDVDLAAYLRPEKFDDRRLSVVLGVVRDLLLKVYPQVQDSQIQIDPPAVTIAFKESGLDVDVVPVIPNGEPDDRGLLAIRGGKEWIETSIPLHLDFIRKRSEKWPNYRPLVRLTKWWAEIHALPVTSFELELLWAHVLATGFVAADDLQEALLRFFSYIEQTRIGEPIVFTDNYEKADAEFARDVVTIMDPVNPKNNVAGDMSLAERDELVEAAEQALDFVAAASTAHTKGRGTDAYQQVFGAAFAV